MAQTCSVPRADPRNASVAIPLDTGRMPKSNKLVLILRLSVTMDLEGNNTASHGVSTGFSESEIINRTIACFGNERRNYAE